MNNSFAIRQSEQSQFGARRGVISVQNASNPQTFCDLDEHSGIFDIDDLTGWHLGDIQRQPEHVSVGLADVHKAGGNEGIHRSPSIELSLPLNSSILQRNYHTVATGDLPEP